MATNRMNGMIEKVIRTIETYKMLKSKDKVLVGISGGPDSVALLHILNILKESFNISIAAVHINHNLRGEEALKDQEYVQRFCSSLNIPLTIEEVNILEVSKERKLSVEAAGRECRYEIFNKYLEKLGAQRIAVAHNANDNAETILMRAIRGTGLEGLIGIKPIRDNIIRPLIEITREEIEEYCNNNNLCPRIDSSNLDNIYTRNKIRLDLIPYLKREFNENIINTLNRMSRILEKDNAYISDMVQKSLKDVIILKNKEYILINLEKIYKQDKLIASRILRYCIQEFTESLVDIESKNIEDALELVFNGSTGSKLDLPQNIRLTKSYNELIISTRDYKQDMESFCYNITIPGVIKIDQLGTVLEANLVQRTEIKLDKYTQAFDFDKINGLLMLRTRQNGDVFSPKGMSGTKKLKDYFIDKKTPRTMRDTVPLIALDKEILWIIGECPSEKFGICETTKNILLLKYKGV